MKSFDLIGRMLLLLALAGLLLAPSGAAMAGPSMSGQAMTAMAGKMDCCPEQQAPMPDCGKACPFVAFCSAGIGSVVTSEPASFDLRVLAGATMPRGHYLELASLAGKPPSRPPRL